MVWNKWNPTTIVWMLQVGLRSYALKYWTSMNDAFLWELNFCKALRKPKTQRKFANDALQAKSVVAFKRSAHSLSWSCGNKFRSPPMAWFEALMSLISLWISPTLLSAVPVAAFFSLSTGPTLSSAVPQWSAVPVLFAFKQSAHSFSWSCGNKFQVH